MRQLRWLFLIVCVPASCCVPAFSAEIHDAVAANNLERVKALLAEDAQRVDARDDFSRATPLHYAISKEMAELLIAGKADVNAKARGGNTPLHFSVNAASAYLFRNAKAELRADAGQYEQLQGLSYTDVAEVLLTHGATVDLADDSGATALMRAANKEVAQLLVAHGASANARDRHGRTALFTTASAEVAEYLVAQKVDVNARDDAGFTALHTAWDSTVALTLIKHQADVNALNDAGQSPIFFQNGSDYLRTVNLLLANEAKVDLVDKAGSTPLKAALERRHYDAALLLANNGAKVDVFDAATLGLTAKLGLLLKSDPKLIAARDAAQRTPLHWAAMRSQTDTAQFLLDNGAEVDARDENERTPLICAGRSKPEVARLLLEHKADIDASDKDGHCLLEEAMSTYTREQFKLIESYRRKGSSELTEAISAGDATKVQGLLDGDPQLVRTRDELAATPLHWAAAKGSVLMVRILIQYKADVNALSFDEGTPLLDAALLGQKENARVLIDNGATVDVFAAAALGLKDKLAELIKADPAQVWVALHGGQTPLHLAARTGQTAIVEMLLAEKANVNAVDKTGLTPLDYALTAKQDNIAALLQHHGGKIGKLSE